MLVPLYQYEWSKDVTYLNEMRAQLQEPGTTVVFVPPMSYLLKRTSEARSATPEFITANSAAESVNVTEELLADTDNLQNAYDIVRSEEEQQRNEVLLNPLAATPRTDWDRRLECEWEGDYNFVNVYDNGDTTYGGDQRWFTNQAGYDSGKGCGPVAAANSLYYMSSRHSGYKTLWPYLGFSKVYFLSLMKTMWQYIQPSLFGEFSLESYSTDVERYCRDRGVNMWSFPVYANSYNKDACIEVILDGLGWDSPVSMLNLSLNVPDDGDTWDKDYNWHWMTITKYFSLGEKAWVAVSTWGQRRSINFHVLYKNMSSAPLGGSGFTYFRLGDS